MTSRFAAMKWIIGQASQVLLDRPRLAMSSGSPFVTEGQLSCARGMNDADGQTDHRKTRAACSDLSARRLLSVPLEKNERSRRVHFPGGGLEGLRRPPPRRT